jgi:hypothetical protein
MKRTNLFMAAAFVFLLSSPATLIADHHKTPDLSGTYDIATLTPLERPKEFADSLYLTRELAEKIQAENAKRLTDGSQLSDPDRTAPPDGGDGSAGAAGNVGGYNTFWIDAGDSVNLVDGKFRTSILSSPADGRYPKMTPAGQQRLMKRFSSFERDNQGKAWWVKRGDGAGPYDNMEQRPLAERCLLGFGSTGGPPMLPVLYNNLKRIVQTEDHVMILVEMVHDARIIRLNSEHPPADIQRWLGDSIGWWEGDTLVVDTTNFHPDATFRATSENVRIVERFRRLDDGSLHYSFVVEDPDSWEESLGGAYTWPLTDGKVYEYACHESNYALGNIMRGARLLEQDVMQGSE